MAVARNVVFDPRLAPGGGATEMAISVGLAKKARTIEGVEGWPFRAVAEAMEVIPRTLVQNCGGNAIRVLTALRVRAAISPTLRGCKMCTDERRDEPSGKARGGRALVRRRRRDGQGGRHEGARPVRVGSGQGSDSQDGDRGEISQGSSLVK